MNLCKKLILIGVLHTTICSSAYASRSEYEINQTQYDNTQSQSQTQPQSQGQFENMLFAELLPASEDSSHDQLDESGWDGRAENMDPKAMVPQYASNDPATDRMRNVVKCAMAHPQVGLASWYGPRFQGRPTANGERFDTRKLTAASRTLPLGMRIRVLNRATGRTIIVRINDRGPYADTGHRIIDLSRAAATAIGMDGMARVQLDCG